MIITNLNLNILLKNVQKSNKAITIMLEEHSSGPYDIIFLQEASPQHIQSAASINNKDGDPVIGLPIHASWTNIPTYNARSQVAAYVHNRVFYKFHFMVDTQTFNHANILALKVTNPHTSSVSTYINIYQNPNRDAPIAQRFACETLLLSFSHHLTQPKSLKKKVPKTKRAHKSPMCWYNIV